MMILRSFTLVKRVRSLFLKTLARQKFKVSNKIAAMKSSNQRGRLHLLYKPLWGGEGRIYNGLHEEAPPERGTLKSIKEKEFQGLKLMTGT